MMIALVGLGVSAAVSLIIFLVVRRKIRQAVGTPVWHLRKNDKGTRWY